MAHSQKDSSGALAIVLHTHMPYVEGFGTWPFGEEWLWEAMATSYLPLLDVLGRAPITLSLTPVLCDQLSAEGIEERFLSFLRDVRSETHRLDAAQARKQGQAEIEQTLKRSAEDYLTAERRFIDLGKDLLTALGHHASWTSSATHAILPLLATDAGLRLQTQLGVDSFVSRFGEWEGGFWLPECAYNHGIEPVLAESGVRSICLDLTDFYGYSSPRHLVPLVTENGITVFPVDRSTFELAWSKQGYPAHGSYRNYHRYTEHHHRAWSNDGSPYDYDKACRTARSHAQDFVARTIRRLQEASAELGRPALSVCTFDTEFFGHWWYEGVVWLTAVVDEADRQGLEIVTLDSAGERYEPAQEPAGGLPEVSWGTPRNLSTWEGPAVAELAWNIRSAELRLLATGRSSTHRAVRELLALQASDWAFLLANGLAGNYPLERHRDHLEAFDRALRPLESSAKAGMEDHLRNLAPDLSRNSFFSP